MSSMPQAVGELSSWHFLAGPASLCVRAEGFAAGPLPPCAAEAAVVLDLAGELLDALEAAGLARPPWQWVAQLGGMPAGGAQAVWQGREAQARLCLPWSALRGLAGAPDVPGLQWLPTPAECMLARWRLSEEDLAALEPGGLVLLDDAPAPALRARGEVHAARAGEVAEESQLRRWQLVARWDQPLALEVVMGWRGPVPALPVQCQLIEVARPDAALARGRLVPWGSGHAFRIEAV
ncbi:MULTISPECIES: hypothetical protein [Roseateles]|uniref:Uncharacterized protein n=1 Tax=Pelomonas aquatica TaxID=431058 RepID=A0ABU1ZED1_9BURK|nr:MULTISPECIES: hypothetical protein [Roseateles]MDR7298984.1 hypothetical protein [Pelomonas aquatica]